MNLRPYVLLVYLIAFLLAIYSIATIPDNLWRYIELWQKIQLAFSVLLGFCGVLIAYWVYEDGRRIQLLMDEHPGIDVDDSDRELRREERESKIKD